MNNETGYEIFTPCKPEWERHDECVREFVGWDWVAKCHGITRRCNCPCHASNTAVQD
jgi:hypothetical protein